MAIFNSYVNVYQMVVRTCPQQLARWNDLGSPQEPSVAELRSWANGSWEAISKSTACQRWMNDWYKALLQATSSALRLGSSAKPIQFIPVQASATPMAAMAAESPTSSHSPGLRQSIGSVKLK